MLTVLRYPTTSPFTSACRVATGRSAILHMARRWNPSHVFIPCYVPEGVLNPFLQTPTTIVFYKLKNNLHYDSGDVMLKLTENMNDLERPVIIGIQYFGFGIEMWPLAELAHQHGGIMFADCAHSLITGNASAADVVLHSLNKFLPVPDGAIMASRRADLDLSVEENALPSLPRTVIDAYRAHMKENWNISVAPTGMDIGEMLHASENAYEIYYRSINANMELMAQSSESRALEAETDFQAMAEARWAKSHILREHLNPALFVRDENAQFAFPIRCHGNREEMSEALMGIGVVASALKEKWDHIPVDGFDFEAEFIDDHLLLPIGEDVGVEMLLAMANTLNKFA